MELLDYLKEAYGYGNPIILKDIRIGGMSKSAIRQKIYREAKRGNIQSYGDGIYYFPNLNKKRHVLMESKMLFDDIVKEKYICRKTFPELIVYGYISGQSFLNKIGILKEVPEKIEITTNKTSSKKRTVCIGERFAILRKARTEVNFTNYKILQFLDMFHFLSEDELNRYNELLSKYIKKNKFTKFDFEKYISFYSFRTTKMIIESGLINDFK